MSPDVATRATTTAGARPAIGFLVPIGRVLYSLIFVLAFRSHFSARGIAYAASMGVPAASIAVPAAGIIAVVGGLSVALGYRARIGAWLLVVFLVPVTLMMHAFWAAKDPMMAQIQMVNFMKNLSMLGGALLVAFHGAGPVSFDERGSSSGA